MRVDSLVGNSGNAGVAVELVAMAKMMNFFWYDVRSLYSPRSFPLTKIFSSLASRSRVVVTIVEVYVQSKGQLRKMVFMNLRIDAQQFCCTAVYTYVAKWTLIFTRCPVA